MGDYESRQEDYRREAWEEAHQDIVAVEQQKSCHACNGEYRYVETTTYGNDADGNRGVPLKLFACKDCGAELEIRG